MHLKMGFLGLLGLFLTFRKELHDYTRIEGEDRDEQELKHIQEIYRK